MYALQFRNDLVETRKPLVVEYFEASISNNTKKSYLSDLKHFEIWGGQLPTTSKQICSYLIEYAKKLNHSTLTRRIKAIKKFHVVNKLPDPTSDSDIKTIMTGIRNKHGKKRKQAKALTLDNVKSIYTSMIESKTGNDKDSFIFRDLSIILIGFFGFFRRSELININFEDLEFTEKGLTIFIPKSKTDQSSEGAVIAIPFGNNLICPVETLKDWLKIADITEGPVFRSINKSGKITKKRLNIPMVALIIKKYVALAQLPDPDLYSGHSLRRGAATECSRKGASLKSILKQGRWANAASVIPYIEEANLFEENAISSLLD